MAKPFCVACSLGERVVAPALASAGGNIGLRTDEALESQREGNELSVRGLLNRYYAYVLRLVERLARARHWHAEDIIEAQSDAIFALIGAAERFDPTRTGSNGRTCGFQTFLTRLATDRFRDFANKRKRYARRFCVSLDSGHAADNRSHCACRRCRQLAESLASDRSNPAEVAEQNENAARLHAAIAKLKPIYRRVAELDAADTPIDEIAAALKINVQCAKKRRTKARAELRWLMTEGECDAMTSQK